ncbi:hypothetical protein [Paracraurococcus lichenis]|uniref:Heme exporter protein D n=1 Tax=Paracraurococcus lichenis TaxID=3064888 RepID=A0ABT9E140_9PROT|nr:hypothetical protein [Paracraurococcus sp. LOR1-02]MDO9709861.1 hypothetical protein [Paracraurococcus sp. LOR1-02]
MSHDLYANVVLPLGILAVGTLYGLYAVWDYERAMRRERSGKK